jgi:hypothetical protein
MGNGIQAFRVRGRGIRWCFAAMSWAACIVSSLAFASPSWAGTARAVPTFESIGVYWPLADQAHQDRDSECAIAFRAKGAEAWRNGLPLWYDRDTSECRGSIVGLRPGTSYELRLSLKSGLTQELQARTWSEAFPIGRVVSLPEFSNETLRITQSGTPDGYVLYAPPPGKSAVIDVNKERDFNVIIDARYVILRGLTLKGARHSGVLLGKVPDPNSSDVSDIVIENNDISGWGQDDPRCKGKRAAHGTNLQAAVYAFSNRLERVIIQRNKLHHPSTSASNWGEENCSGTGSRHPLGPQGITIRNSLGNLVIRYNEIYSDEEHGFNDAMGEPDNFSKVGFPRRDSDIYGNFISNSWDDGIEAEGADENVRIWGNYIDRVMIPIALAPVAKGPIYIWRNLSYVSRSAPNKKHGGNFIKSRLYTDKKTGTASGGRIYLFNNTSLIPRQGSAASGFIAEFNAANPLRNVVSLNNIMNVENRRRNYSVKDRLGIDNLFDYDLLPGRTAFSDRPQRQEAHGIKGTPKFVPRWGLDAHSLRGTFALMTSSPGYDHGTIIPNFADQFSGRAPDIGAQEAGTPAMEFGVHAYEGN